MIKPDKILGMIGADKAVIPFGTAILLAYIMIWAIEKADKIDVQASQLTAIQSQQAEYNKTVQQIDKRLVRLETLSTAVARRLEVEIENDDSK